ncbi:hypothetical protein VKT23_013410 [Stygiomarasmius scandens]|uniref:Uncharacterized protein n=1 Tax=Marasmiellus scandens TaxID=2682957 RepID=A0ABR1J866_9AGAR
MQLQLPSSLTAWRNRRDGVHLWESLRPFFTSTGLELWKHGHFDISRAPSGELARYPNGYVFAHTKRQDPNNQEPPYLGAQRSFQLKAGSNSYIPKS